VQRVKDSRSCINMSRRSRKSLLQVVLVCVFVYLIYSLVGASAPKLYSWNTIRYQTTAKSLPEARGLCPGLGYNSKPALIVSHVAADGDTAWLKRLESKYHLCVYEVDAPADASVQQLRVPANRGHESITYLTFLIDNYDSIPQAGAVFVHGNRFQWHNDDPLYDNAASLAALNIPSALADTGYHNLRCDWSAGTCPKDSGPAQGSLETSFNSFLQPWSARCASDAAMPRAFAILFGGDEYLKTGKSKGMKLGRSHTLRAQCCAQFVVSRESIHRHSREEYLALRQWLLDSHGMSRSSNAAPRDDLIAGRVLSYIWHILFIPQQDGPMDLDMLNQQACPSASDCYCKLYGKCDLNCNAQYCSGQYRIPPYYRVPDDWVKLHGNDVYDVQEPGVKALHGRLYPKAFGT
jgi:hypothetical protein